MNTSFEPAYIKTHCHGILKDRIYSLRENLTSCSLCPRKCEADRLSGDTGTCNTGEYAFVSSHMPHFGEEAPLVGTKGSGTIFFTHCNLLCLFCQNFDISHQGSGRIVNDRQLADMMLSLQALGCHNINFVSPSHVIPQILTSLSLAIDDGLSVPLVYNTGGYDLVDTLKMLEGIIDIYMPDMKFWDKDISEATCQVRDYPEVMRSAVREMFRQVGDLQMDVHGLATRGLLIRHLVMPSRLIDTQQITKFIAEEISSDTPVNIMSQYRPCGRANEIPSMNRSITSMEFKNALRIAREAGLNNLD